MPRLMHAANLIKVSVTNFNLGLGLRTGSTVKRSAQC
jgi:hypothetical protein